MSDFDFGGGFDMPTGVPFGSGHGHDQMLGHQMIDEQNRLFDEQMHRSGDFLDDDHGRWLNRDSGERLLELLQFRPRGLQLRTATDVWVFNAVTSLMSRVVGDMDRPHDSDRAILLLGCEEIELRLALVESKTSVVVQAIMRDAITKYLNARFEAAQSRLRRLEWSLAYGRNRAAKTRARIARKEARAMRSRLLRWWFARVTGPSRKRKVVTMDEKVDALSLEHSQWAAFVADRKLWNDMMPKRSELDRIHERVAALSKSEVIVRRARLGQLAASVGRTDEAIVIRDALVEDLLNVSGAA